MAYKNAKKNSAHVRELHKQGLGTCKVRYIHKHTGIVPASGRTIPRSVGLGKRTIVDKIMGIFS